MKGRAANLVVACSALLCLATLALWCRSYVLNDRLIYTFHNSSGEWILRHHSFTLSGVESARSVGVLSVGSGQGRLVFSRVGFMIPRARHLPQHDPDTPDYRAGVPYESVRHPGLSHERPRERQWSAQARDHSTLGFARYRGSWMISFGGWATPAWFAHAAEAEVPCWFVALLFGVPPVIVVAKALRRRRRIVGGYCATCGYDLRATPDRCPECGAAVTVPTGAAPEFR